VDEVGAIGGLAQAPVLEPRAEPDPGGELGAVDEDGLAGSDAPKDVDGGGPPVGGVLREGAPAAGRPDLIHR
jgi:hypothetical protein